MEKITTSARESRAAGPLWETLEQYARGEIQQFVQRLLEEEVEELLGRAKSARRHADTPQGVRNGYGKPRQLALMGGTITVQRPRVRDVEARFVSRVLPLFKRQTTAVTALLPELYLHGLALGDFELALRGVLGAAAPLSASAMLRLKAAWQTQYDAWRRRDLAELEVVYLWADGLYVKAGLEDTKAALLVLIGALADGRKVVLAVESGVRESTESWAAILRELSAAETFYRLRVNPEQPADAHEYDSPPAKLTGRGRLDRRGYPVMYGSQDLEVCIHECRATVDDALFVATISPLRSLRLLDLSAHIKDSPTEFESLDLTVHMLFLAGSHSYEICREITSAACEAGFDGVIYPSYFSLVRTGAMPLETIFGISVRQLPSQKEYVKSQIISNVALFGRPLEAGLVRVTCINRVVLNRAAYDISFGPVAP